MWRLSGKALFVVLVAVIGTSACASRPGGLVSGTLLYRERVALTPEAVVDVSLVDVSLADAPAEVIAEETIRDPGQVPIPFELEYDPARIDPKHTYAVQARITDRGRVLFRTTTAHLVLTQGHPDSLQVMLQSESRDAMEPSRPGVGGTDGIVGSWALDSFGEGEAAEPPSDPAPTLVLDESGRASGSTGCNRLTGSYTVAQPASLSFSPLASTRMACLDPSIAAQETRYLEALGKAAGFSVSEGRLRLTDAQGNVLLVYRREGAAGDTTTAGNRAGVPESFYYECGDEYRFVAQTLDSGERVRLLLPDTTVTLSHVVSASDAKYGDESWTYWRKGDEAQLETPEGSRPACGLESSGPWEEARARGVDFRASGNEPGWNLEIDEDDETLLVMNYGETRVSFPPLRPESDPSSGRTTYRWETESHPLTVMIEDEPCRDDMSGWPFEATVRLTFDGQEYRGCGRWLSRPD